MVAPSYNSKVVSDRPLWSLGCGLSGLPHFTQIINWQSTRTEVYAVESNDRVSRFLPEIMNGPRPRLQALF
jgi:hypothetical protein